MQRILSLFARQASYHPPLPEISVSTQAVVNTKYHMLQAQVADPLCQIWFVTGTRPGYVLAEGKTAIGKGDYVELEDVELRRHANRTLIWKVSGRLQRIARMEKGYVIYELDQERVYTNLDSIHLKYQRSMYILINIQSVRLNPTSESYYWYALTTNQLRATYGQQPIHTVIHYKIWGPPQLQMWSYALNDDGEAENWPEKDDVMSVWEQLYDSDILFGGPILRNFRPVF